MIRLTSYQYCHGWIEVGIEFDRGRYSGHHDIVLYTSPEVWWVLRADTVETSKIDGVISVTYRSVTTLQLPDKLPTYLLVDDELLRVDL